MADSTKRTVDAEFLRKRKAEFLRQQEEQFDRDMAALAEIAKRYDLPLSDVISGQAKTPKPPHSTDNARAPATVFEIVDAAVAVLKQRGTRLQSSAIAAILSVQGLYLGDNPGKKVSSYLTRRTAVFDNKPEYGGYGLVEWNGARGAPSKAKVI